MLPQSLPAPVYLTLTYRPDMDVLVVRWQRQTTTAELQAGYFAVLEAAAALPCRYWLMDVRGREDSNKQHTNWMLETFFPLLPERFGAQVCISYLFAPTHLAEVENAPEVPSLAYFDGKPYCVGRFIEEAAALAWLRAQRAA